MFMTPVFGVLSGWLVLSEHVTWTQLGGGALVATSIYLVNRTAQPTAASGRAKTAARAS
jgi:drug/metabolite transporter (DMT)-like permease